MHLSGDGHEVRLTVVDNGAGFDVDAARGKGLGFLSMRERLEPLRGTLAIQSTPGEGTRIVAVTPIRPQPGDA